MKRDSLFVWTLLALFFVSLGCNQTSRAKQAGRFQGIIELQELTLGFEVSGRLSAVHAKAGDWVTAGAPLATLDDTLARLSLGVRAAEVKAAEASYALLQAGVRKEDVDALAAQLKAAKENEALLKKNLQRQQDLVAKDAAPATSVDTLSAELSRARAERKVLEEKLSALKKGARPEELEAALARVEAAQSALALEEERLRRYHLKAASSGKVVEVYVEPGELVSVGMPVLTVADTHHPYVDIFVPQGDTDGIFLGMKATVWVDAQKEPLFGKVENIGRKVEFTPRFLFSEEERSNLVIRVRVRIDDPKEHLHSGVPAFVSLGDDAQGGI